MLILMLVVAAITVLSKKPAQCAAALQRVATAHQDAIAAQDAAVEAQDAAVEAHQAAVGACAGRPSKKPNKKPFGYQKPKEAPPENSVTIPAYLLGEPVHIIAKANSNVLGHLQVDANCGSQSDYCPVKWVPTKQGDEYLEASERLRFIFEPVGAHKPNAYKLRLDSCDTSRSHNGGELRIKNLDRDGPKTGQSLVWYREYDDTKRSSDVYLINRDVANANKPENSWDGDYGPVSIETGQVNIGSDLGKYVVWGLQLDKDKDNSNAPDRYARFYFAPNGPTCLKPACDFYIQHARTAKKCF